MAPSREDRLIALACSVAERRRAGADAARRLAAQARSDVLLERLERQRLTALAGSRLQALDVLPARLEQPVREALSENRLRTLVFDGANAEVLAALESAGVAALPLKGVSLADAVYDDPGLRRYADVDVLVGAGELWRAVDVVRRLGYAPEDPCPLDSLPDLHIRMTPADAWRPPVELHWRIHWFERGFSAGMLRRSQMRDGRRRARAVDELAALLLFYARDGFRGLRGAADAAAWWDARGAELEAGSLRAVERMHPEVTTALKAAASVLEELVGLPVGHLVGGPPLPGRARAAVRLANWPEAGTNDQIEANATLVDLLLSPTAQLGASARRHLFLRRAVLEDFYGLPRRAFWRRLFWRAVHPPKMLSRYARALWSVRGDRAWAERGPCACRRSDRRDSPSS